MPKTYANDLRRKFFEACDSGEGTLEGVAERFRVSVGWAKKISARRIRTGEINAPGRRGGRPNRVTAAVREWIREQIRAPSIFLSYVKRLTRLIKGPMPFGKESPPAYT